QHGHALAFQPELLAARGPFRNPDPAGRAVERRHLDLPAERRRGHRDRDLAEDVRPVALEERVRLDGEEDVEIAGRTAAQARLAVADEAHFGPVLDTGRDVDRERPLARDAPRARAGRARIVDHLAAADARRAGPLDGEEALAGAHLADAAAGRAGRGLGAD